MSEKTTKRPVWVWVVGAVVILGLAALIGYNVWRSTPRRFSQIFPEAKTAVTCQVKDWGPEGQERSVTGEELAGLVEYLDRFELYPKIEGLLAGDDLWLLTFLQEDGSHTLIHVASQGVSLESRVYEVRSGAIELPD